MKNKKKQAEEKQSKYALPIKEIKMDLVKTFMFAIFSIVVIVSTHFLLPKVQVDQLLKGLF